MYPSNDDKKSYASLEQLMEVSPINNAPPHWPAAGTNRDILSHLERRRSPHDRLGIYNTCVLISTTFLILAAICLLTLIWVGALRYTKGDELPMLWSNILEHHWIPRTITISSVAIRMGVVAQLGVSTAMLAAVLLESVGVGPREFALLSIIRCINTGPISLAPTVLSSFRSLSELGYSAIIIIAVLNTLVLQFTSTILISDFRFGPAKFSTSDIAFELSGNRIQTVEKYRGIDYWKTGPASYPSFAEYSEPPYEHNGYKDTGKTYRAYLPFGSQFNRTRLRNYMGVASIADTRAICVAPNITNLISFFEPSAYLMDDKIDVITMYGELAWNDKYPGLQSANKTWGGSSTFNCSIPLPNYMTTSIFPWVAVCWISTSPADITDGFLKASKETASTNTQSWLLLNATADRDAWKPLFHESNTTSVTWQLTSSEVWTTVSHGNVGFDITLCFTNPAPSNHYVEISNTANQGEPILSWNPGSSAYDTREIRRMLGATAEHYSLKDRGVFALQQPSDWRPITDIGPRYKSTIDYISQSWLYGFGGFNGVGSKNGDGSKSTAIFTSEGTPPYPNSVHRSHTALAMDILSETQNPALALQALMTIIMQMSYYEFLQQFDVSVPANYTMSSDVEIPVQWKGFTAVIFLLLLHFGLVFFSISIFLKNTKLSLLGNAWQAVAHTASPDASAAIQHASELTDKEIGEFMERNGMTRGRFIVKRSVANGRSEGIMLNEGLRFKC